MQFFKISFLIHIVNLIVRIICFTSLGNKMENKLGKTNFTENVDVINFLKIKKTAKISKFHSEKSKVNSQTNLL
jgi:hypothetical protein